MNITIDNILNPIGLTRKNFIVKSCDNIENAVALIYKNNRYIMMDEHFFSSISKDNTIAYYLILSHEIAHHLNGHTSDFENHSNSTNQKQELECDYFAGFVLSNLGFSLDKSIFEANRLLFDPNYNVNSSHPPLSKRIESIKKGFYDSQNKINKTIESLYNIIQEEYTKAFEENFDNRLTYLYNEARNGYLDIVLNNKFIGIDEVISNYQKIDYLSNDITFIKVELGQLNYRNQNYASAYNYFLSAYKIGNDSKYLIDALQVCYEGGLNINSELFNQLLTLDYNTLNHPNRYKYLAIFTSQNNPQRAIDILTSALVNWPKFNLKDWEYFLKPNLFADLSVLLVRQEEYSKAYNAIIEAYNLYDVDNKIRSNLSTFDKQDFATVLENKALIEMRLEEWDKCINTSNLLISYFPESTSCVAGSIDYYIGRCSLEKKDYTNSILYLSEAIRKSDRNDYLYFYRGLAYKKIGELKKSNIDLTIACDKKIKAACENLNK
jgi:tetratricopeptide (TPR) repeat protein